MPKEGDHLKETAMPNPAHETPDEFTVTSIYQSCPDPAMNEDGYEVQLATLPTGAVHSLVLFDHVGGDMVEMPPEVALSVAMAIFAKLNFPISTLN